MVVKEDKGSLVGKGTPSAPSEIVEDAAPGIDEVITIGWPSTPKEVVKTTDGPIVMEVMIGRPSESYIVVNDAVSPAPETGRVVTTGWPFK
jgi:hypothetical protein